MLNNDFVTFTVSGAAIKDVMRSDKAGRGGMTDRGITRRSFVARIAVTLGAVYGGLLRGLPGFAVDQAEATTGSGAELASEGAALGAMQLAG